MIHKNKWAHHPSHAKWKNSFNLHGFADGSLASFDDDVDHGDQLKMKDENKDKNCVVATLRNMPFC